MAWLNGWHYRKKITIDESKIDEELTNFPLLVKLTSSNFDFSKSLENGFDIRFTSNDGISLLSFERERHNNVTSNAEYWVKAPSIASGANTELYIYYGKDDATDGADVSNVWDANFKAVWHMNQASSGTVLDSTQNNTDSVANTLTTAEGKIGSGYSNATTSYAGFGNVLSFERTSPFTLEAWVKTTDTTNWICIMAKQALGASNWRGYQFFKTATNVLDFALLNTGTPSNKIESHSASATISDGNWHYVAVAYSGDSDADTMSFNIDGETQTTIKDAETLTATTITTAEFRLFARLAGTYWTGSEDECRVSDIMRTNAWLKASFNSGNDTLLALDVEEGEPPTTINGTILSTTSSPISGVAISFSGDTSGVVYTDIHGEFSITGMTYLGDYTITPLFSNAYFSPTNYIYTDKIEDVTGQDFSCYISSPLLKQPNQKLKQIIGKNEEIDFYDVRVINDSTIHGDLVVDGGITATISGLETDPLWSAVSANYFLSEASSAFSLSGHNHDTIYYPLSGSGEFSLSGHNHAGTYIEVETDPIWAGVSADVFYASGSGAFSLSGHNHDAEYYPLDGSGAFSLSGHNHDADYYPLDGSGAFLGTGISSAFVSTGGDDIVGGLHISGGVTATGDICTVGWQGWDGSPVGWDAVGRTQTIYYKKVGDIVFVNFLIAGTSTGTTCQFTLPYASSHRVDSHAITVDSGTSTTTGGHVNIGVTTSTVNIFKDCADNAFTATGSKLVLGQFWYHV